MVKNVPNGMVVTIDGVEQTPDDDGNYTVTTGQTVRLAPKDGYKVVRAEAMEDIYDGTANIANGNVYIPEGENWLVKGSGYATIEIGDGATVTLADLDIYNDGDSPIICDGDATIILTGSNSVITNASECAGIRMSGDIEKTLTINGEGSLYVGVTGQSGAGIGTNAYGQGGYIRIESGDISVVGGYRAAGIGCGQYGSCLRIDIVGGTVSANGGNQGSGIGAGYSDSYNTSYCGTVAISGGTVTAYGGSNAAGIGTGVGNSNNYTVCSSIDITGGTITATGQGYGAAIGTARYGKCIYIHISADVNSVTVTKGDKADNHIGAGPSRYAECYTVDIEDYDKIMYNW